MTNPKTPRFPSSLRHIIASYDAVLCDIWGVIHNGVAAFPDALFCLRALKMLGIPVVLITNAPRPSAQIKIQLEAFGVHADDYRAIVTSGDVTIALIAQHHDAAIYHIGPERDLALFEAVTAATGASPKLADVDTASVCVCTGLYNDECETPDDYASILGLMANKSMPMICANPDIVVHRGEEMIYCAGAIAKAYGALSGKVLYAGKPHAPIYARAKTMALPDFNHNRRDLVPKKFLAIGDGLQTDVLGAKSNGCDCLFIADGIHRSEFFVSAQSPSAPYFDGEACAQAVSAYANKHQIDPVEFVMQKLEY